MSYNKRWQKTMANGTTRYYCADITQDLFDLIVQCSWGTVGTKRGGSKIFPVKTQNEALQCMESIAKLRKQRGYIEQ